MRRKASAEGNSQHEEETRSGIPMAEHHVQPLPSDLCSAHGSLLPAELAMQHFFKQQITVVSGIFSQQPAPLLHVVGQWLPGHPAGKPSTVSWIQPHTGSLSTCPLLPMEPPVHKWVGNSQPPQLDPHSGGLRPWRVGRFRSG